MQKIKFSLNKLKISVLLLLGLLLLLSLGSFARLSNLPKPAHADTCPYHGTPLTAAMDGTALTTGDYYLTGDLTISTGFTLAAGATVNICLNGYMLSCTSTTNYAINFTGGTLNLYDCGNTVEQKHYYTKDPTTGAYVFGSGTDYISGGIVSGKGAIQGYGVTGSEFNMFSGTIAGSWQGVFSGGAYVTTNIYGGKLCGNYIYALYVLQDSKMNLYGCEITDNVSTTGGGAVYVSPSCNITVQGDVRIYDNYFSDGRVENLHLAHANYMTDATITIGSAGLSPNAYIGLTVPTGQNYDSGNFIINNSSQSNADLLNNYFFDDAAAHSYGKIVPQVDPTCTTNGLKAHYLCSLHGEYFDSNKNQVDYSSLVIPATGHNYALSGWQWASDYSSATATFACSDCGDTYTQTVTPTKQQTYPDCTSTGTAVYTATVTLPDGSTATDTATETIPAAGHTWDSGTVVPPTCTTGGYTLYTCTVCGDTKQENLVPATGHSYTVTSWQWASDYSSATATYVCSVCGDTGTLTATPTSTKTDPDCTTDGNIVYTATVNLPDGTTATDTATDTIPATGHTYQVTGWVWASDYSTATATYVCSVCGDTGTVTGNSTYVQTDPTCTVDGLIGYTVTVTLPDGTTATDNNGQTLPATGHQWDSGTVVPPTCTDDGYTIYTCTVCGDTKKDDIVPTTGHQWDSGTVVPPTCTDDGYTIYTCTVCGDTKKEDPVPATGHTYQFSGWEWADDYSSAKVIFNCSVCGDKITYPADSITYIDDEEQGTRTYMATAVIDGVTYTDEQTAPIPAPIISGCMGCVGGIDWLLILCIGMLLFDVVMFAITMRVICSKPKDDDDDEDEEEKDDGPDGENEFY